MDKKIIALFLVTLAVIPAFALAVKPLSPPGKPVNPGPWKIVGKKAPVTIDGGTCAVMKSGSKGIQIWCYWLDQPHTLSADTTGWTWLDSTNELKTVSGFRLHAVGKLTNTMKLGDAQAIRQGYDIKWTASGLGPLDGEYYLKFNWVK